MRESIVVVGAALSADVDAPTERIHSALSSAPRSIAWATGRRMPGVPAVVLRSATSA